MPYPFLRPGESGPQPDQPGAGLRVTRGGLDMFFPGGTPDLAMIVARLTAPPGLLDAADTTIEFGVKYPDGRWDVRRVVKAPPTPATQQGW